jgi:hypothetical protein
MADDGEDALAYYDRRMNEPLREEPFPDDVSEAMRLEPHRGRLVAWFLRTHPLGPDGERMLAELNEQSRAESPTAEWDDTTAAMISNLNEARVREQLGLPQVPTP